jgi:steroid delta-isomerase-like uncharacterized protein
MKIAGLLCGLATLAGCAGSSERYLESEDAMRSNHRVTINKAVVRRFYEECVNLKRADLLPSLVTPDIVNHTNGGRGIESLATAVSALHVAFEDLAFEVVDMIGEGDRVALRYVLRGKHVGPFAGQPASGKFEERPGINTFRLKDSKIAEVWLAVDPRTLRPPAPQSN